MDFHVLGPLEVVEEGASLPLGGPRQRALLALLLLHSNHVVSTERLIDDLWGESTPAGGSAAVQNQVARLRKVLGSDRIETRHAGYSIRVGAGELDLDRFRDLVQAAGGAGPGERSTLLVEALGLWRGTPLSGLPDAPYVAPERARLEGLRLQALEERINADLELGRHAELVGELSSLAARYPLQERLRAHLMLALYRSGRQAEALDVYRETRRMLADELGLEPGQVLRDLEHAVLAQDPSLDPPPRPGKPAAAAKAAVAEPERPRHKHRVAATVLVAAALGAAGVLTALALDRAPTAESAAPTSALPSVPSTEPQSTTAVMSPTTKTDTSGQGSPVPATVTTTATTPAPQASNAPPAASVPSTSSSVPSKPKKQETGKTSVPVPAPTTTTASPQLTTPTATTPTATTPTTKTGPLRIEDRFTSSVIDPTIWHTVREGTGSDVLQQAGKLVLTIAADGSPSGTHNVLGAHTGTQCKFPADFDARVDFTLLEWGAATNVRAGLHAYFADSFVGRMSSSTWGDQYVSWVVPANGPVSLPEMTGSLRVARVGTIVTTYFWHNERWVALASGPSSGVAVLGLEAAAGADFGHEAIRVAYDNFAVEARDFDCPPGSTPPAA
jgi:DNA-binding SARP family transcriptional activator